MNVLVITDVLPAPIIASKRQENDVLLTSAEIHESIYKGSTFTFVFIVPYSNSIISIISARWKEYTVFKKLRSYTLRGREVTIMPVPYFREKDPWNWLLIRVGYQLNRNKLKKLITEKQIDLVHAHNIKSDLGIAYCIYKEMKIPYVVTTRKLGKLKLDKFITKGLASAEALVSLGYREKAIADMLNTNSFVVPHGIDDRFLKQKKTYASTNNALKIVTVCRLLQWKNIDKIFFALEQIKGEFTYDIYGEGPDLARLKLILSKTSLNNKVNFLGHVPYEEVPTILSRYDLFVLPSYFEMFGRVYIEAMACGIPVIGAKNCGIDGYIQNGEHGFVVNHENVEELREAINKFIWNKGLLSEMGKNAKTLAFSFSWHLIVEKLENIYCRALSQQRS